MKALIYRWLQTTIALIAFFTAVCMGAIGLGQLVEADVLAFSASGESFVYTGTSLYVMDVARHLKARWLPIAIWPAWSPDGEQLAYLSYQPDGTHVYIVTPYSQQSRHVATFADVVKWMYWSPDGYSLYFSGGGTGDVYRLSLQSGIITPMTRAVHADYMAVPAPQGRYLALVSNRDGAPSIYLMDTEAITEFSEGMTLLTNPHVLEWSPQWSPDGRQIAYLARDERYELRILDLETRQQHIVATFDVDMGYVDLWAWLAGNRLMLTIQNSSTLGDIYLYNSDSQQLIPLSHTSMDETHPAIRP
ncbi:MAG: hypothetical protein D6712_12500 [Chloroflexi bacterium]|nr:MAG: hypothetical protein D6712_12500 [Chloroflexota bacterium]